MFHQIKSEDFKSSPFPHMFKDSFMEDDPFRALMSELKKIERVKRRIWSGDKNMVVDPLDWSPESDDIEKYPMVKNVMQYFRSENFYKPLINEWSKYLPSRLGITASNITNSVFDLSNCQLRFDAAGNAVKIRDPHVDHPKDILVWLFYCRLPEDSSTGGDFTLFSYKRGFRGFKINTLKDARYFNDRDLTLEQTIHFKPNRLVAFLNGMDSVHGITDRKNAKVSRIKFTGGIFSEDAKIDSPLEDSPVWRFIYHPLNLAQRTIIKVKKVFGGRTSY